jgi:hypothetical protein
VSKEDAFTSLQRLTAVAALCASIATPLQAAPVRLEAFITPKAESKLEFADGTKRYLLATQREGKAEGTGPLAGATMLEWGAHDVTPGVGSTGSGYLVFTTSDGDIAYLKYQFRMLVVPGAEGKPHPLINGHWEVAGGTGKLKGLRGAGTVHVKVVSPKERHWILEGDLS